MKVYENISLCIQLIVAVFIAIWYAFQNMGEDALLIVAGCISIVVMIGFVIYANKILIQSLKMRKRTRVWLEACILVISIVALVFCSGIDQYEDVNITVECGDRNTEAKSAEVWISAWGREDVEYSSSSLRVENVDNIVYRSEYDSYVYTSSNGSGYGEISLQFSGDGCSFIEFNMHPWCGIVKIHNSTDDEILIDTSFLLQATFMDCS
jgi:hypothetical protein